VLTELNTQSVSLALPKIGTYSQSSLNSALTHWALRLISEFSVYWSWGSVTKIKTIFQAWSQHHQTQFKSWVQDFDFSVETHLTTKVNPSQKEYGVRIEQMPELTPVGHHAISQLKSVNCSTKLNKAICKCETHIWNFQWKIYCLFQKFISFPSRVETCMFGLTCLSKNKFELFLHFFFCTLLNSSYFH